MQMVFALTAIYSYNMSISSDYMTAPCCRTRQTVMECYERMDLPMVQFLS
jgi:hypothetical protein